MVHTNDKQRAEVGIRRKEKVERYKIDGARLCNMLLSGMCIMFLTVRVSCTAVRVL